MERCVETETTTAISNKADDENMGKAKATEAKERSNYK